MVSPDELERVLRDFNFTYNTQVAGVLTKTGVPMAIQATVDLEEDHFGTMAATLIGSAEVIHRGISLGPPRTILVRSEDGLMLVINLGKNAFFVAVGGEDSDLEGKVQEASEALLKVLQPLKPLEKFAR